MLSVLCVRLTIKVKMGIPESFKVGWYPPPPKKKEKTGLSHLKTVRHNKGVFKPIVLQIGSLNYLWLRVQ